MITFPGHQFIQVITLHRHITGVKKSSSLAPKWHQLKSDLQGMEKNQFSPLSTVYCENPGWNWNQELWWDSFTVPLISSGNFNLIGYRGIVGSVYGLIN